MDDLFRVPDNAGGNGFEPADGFSERWLDSRQLHKGDCVPYMGRACRNYLTGKFIMLTSDNRDDIYDIGESIKSSIFSPQIYFIIIIGV